ncbi:MAG: DUF512 domain-containing protein [Armatimonadota bacterium]|nr:DUF512 domain-containing protein [bacterium]
MGGIISSVDPGSIAEDLGWRKGDEIISINGHDLSDVIDFRFYSSDEFLTILLRRGDQTAEFEIEKDFDIPLGANFADVLFDGERTCGAHCIFCFVEQLPKGLRKSLYLKDDDFRLSFLHGNFVTLANVSDQDLQRIITQRLSPLYVSVHATEQGLREKMLGRSAPSILRQIDTLAEGHISLHTQIVLCRGINDAEHLDQTVSDLASHYPAVQSIAIVPVGLSAHRRNKTPIGSIDSEYSSDIISRVKRWQRRFLCDYGTRLIWAADEFYLNADLPVPSASFYEGFPQIENGVGLVRKFKDSARRAARILPDSLPRATKISIVTGRAAGSLLKDWADSVQTKNLSINVYPIKNTLFGEMVTVTGLISGKDIIEQLKGKDLGDAIIIPSVSLRDCVFLDDITLDDVQIALGIPVIVVKPLPYQLAKRICEGATRS